MADITELFGFGLGGDPEPAKPKKPETKWVSAPTPTPAKPTVSPDMTLAEAKAIVERGRWDKQGVRCPCCDRYAKVYKRGLNATMVRFLIWLVRNYERDQRWYAITEYPHSRGGDHAKLLYWKMVEQQSNDDPTKSHSGSWRPTQFGIDFVHRRARTKSHAVVYANEVIDHEGKDVTVVDCLGKKFDYSRLMAGITE